MHILQLFIILKLGALSVRNAAKNIIMMLWPVAEFVIIQPFFLITFNYFLLYYRMNTRYFPKTMLWTLMDMFLYFLLIQRRGENIPVYYFVKWCTLHFTLVITRFYNVKGRMWTVNHHIIDLHCESHDFGLCCWWNCWWF